jgi:hypothetical protein
VKLTDPRIVLDPVLKASLKSESDAVLAYGLIVDEKGKDPSVSPRSLAAYKANYSRKFCAFADRARDARVDARNALNLV